MITAAIWIAWFVANWIVPFPKTSTDTAVIAFVGFTAAAVLATIGVNA